MFTEVGFKNWKRAKEKFRNLEGSASSFDRAQSVISRFSTTFALISSTLIEFLYLECIYFIDEILAKLLVLFGPPSFFVLVPPMASTTAATAAGKKLDFQLRDSDVNILIFKEYHVRRPSLN
ncbi:hypothetical protein M9H77_11450 [Catharanthus roseus]|uniref:Uncharacterized protein n=1 Tax=Catharanthus roseus TaxID=4058 RepID=A0ACC0BEK5_CATRO|nr:hypothetical protein M9H77_11450 [Catharanthus roseus]